MKNVSVPKNTIKSITLFVADLEKQINTTFGILSSLQSALQAASPPYQRYINQTDNIPEVGGRCTYGESRETYVI